MRKSVFIRITSISLILVVAAGCSRGLVISHPVPGRSAAIGLPPGQAKKVYGHQSARAFAPGQQKKSPLGESRQNQHKYKKSKKKK
jgi:hypothetical protein